jgi:CTP synthase
MKYLIITGGVISGIGKGVSVSSIGLIFKLMNLIPTAIKIDPYLNIDAGTMSPYEHGEVFVLDDGSETDLDLGNYERFMDITLTGDSNITTGKIYNKVIAKERKGNFLGKTVQVIPHVTDEIKTFIQKTAHKKIHDKIPDVCIIELGGTIGDIESMPFIEALRQLQMDIGKDKVCFGHISMIPTTMDNEQKTKPTQHSVKELMSFGIIPDFIIGRSERILHESTKNKLALFCQVPMNNIFTLYNLDNIHKIPILLLQQNFNIIISKKFNLINTINILSKKKWDAICNISYNKIIYIGIVGKYNGLKDSYLSILSALKHAGDFLSCKVEIIWINAENIEQKNKFDDLNKLNNCHGILIPGGFGDRGIEGKKRAINYARQHNIPLLGICLGMQLMVIEKLETLLNKRIYSEEFNLPNSPIHRENAIIYIPHSSNDIGGTMRLGIHKVIITKGTLAHKIYKTNYVYERHRHRYEINPDYISILAKEGYIFSGVDESNIRMEIVECNKHPFFIGTQFHPEFLSRPTSPSLIFLEYLKKCITPTR